MVSEDSQRVADQAEAIYEQHLKTTLEGSHPGAFVAIEPVSGDHFLGHTLSEVIQAARQAHPQDLSHVIRIGHKTAVHIGACSSCTQIECRRDELARDIRDAQQEFQKGEWRAATPAELVREILP